MASKRYGMVLGTLLVSAVGCSSDSGKTTSANAVKGGSGKSGSAGSGTAGEKASAGKSGAGGTGKTGTGSAGKAGSGNAGAGGSATSMGSPGDTDACPVVVKDADCDKSQRPIVFVHGTFGSGDNIANVALLFGSNGYCQDRFVAVEYNSLGASPVQSGSLDALIDKVRADTGMDQVDLAGHSQGTGHCVNYLSDATHAAKVAHYINLSGGGMVPNNVPTLSLSSMNDLMGMPHHAPNAEKQVTFMDEDHFGVAASKNAFTEIWKYLHDGKDPQYTEVQCGEDPITLEGIAETFADNTPITGGKLELRELDPSGAPNATSDPEMVLDAQDDGQVGPIQLKRLVAYDFRALDAGGKPIGHVYFSPFKRSNRLARFLSPSNNPLVASNTTDKVAKGDGFSALVGRYYAGAFRHDLGDSLMIGGQEILTDQNAGRTLITVGLFMSDQNMNGQSDLGVSFSQSFIIGTDVFVDASKPSWFDVRWTPNGGSELAMKIPGYPSSSEGIFDVVFQ